jgi:tripartite-type tricarboxylate transporter receptor subunit TctC
MIRSKGIVALPLLATLISGTVAIAQDFPTKAVELVLPFGAGGSHDLTARAVASVAYRYLGQPLLVVLKLGGGPVGSQQVIKAKDVGGTGPAAVFPSMAAEGY